MHSETRTIFLYKSQIVFFESVAVVYYLFINRKEDTAKHCMDTLLQPTLGPDLEPTDFYFFLDQKMQG